MPKPTSSPQRRTMNRADKASAKSPGGATTPGGGKSAAEIVRQSNRWRDNYNPLRNLVISRVVSILEAAERGDYAELQLVMRKVEKRYPVLKALKARRLAALEKLDWDIKVVDPLPEGVSEAEAEKQRTFLRSRYELIENLTEAFGFLVTAEFRGYALLQKHRCTEPGPNDGAVEELHWLPQDQFCRDGQFGAWYYNKDSRIGLGQDSCKATLGEANRIGSEQLPLEDFIIREVESPLYEIALIAFTNWAMGRKDWSAFVEIFGLPNAIAIMPPQIPQGKEDEYRSAAEKVADGVSGALPNGSDVKFPTASVRGNAPFKEFCDAHDQDVVLAGTGGLLTMLSMPQGIGAGSSGEHGDAFDDIAEADARKINSILQAQFDKCELEAEFPGKPKLAYFELAAQTQEDSKAIVENYGIAVRAGLVTPNTDDEAHFREKMNLPPMSKDVLREWKKLNGTRAPITIQNETPGGGGGFGNQPPQLRNREAVPPSPQAALAETLAPILQRLQAIAAIADDETRTAMLQKFLADEPAMRDALKLDPALQRSLQPLIEKEMNL